MERYSISTMIGEGSFGRVFKGEDKQTGEVVALKLIPKVGHTEKDLKSLRCECKIQKELRHPNIVRMIDAFETDNEVVSVAEFVPGELFRLFDQYRAETAGSGQRRLPEWRVREIAGALVSALHYLHTNRVLHRDIKPQNILLDNQGRAKLCDFGFARNLGLDTFVLTSIKGTPLYMAPELIEEKPYDHTADIWSLGCIIYELLVGVPPFSTTSLFQLIKKIRYESIQWPPHLSGLARAWLQGTLEKDCRKRLSWPGLHSHPFVNSHVNIAPEQSEALTALTALTNTLTASQELAKEMQRQDKARLLPGGSQTLIKVAQKHELQKQQLAAAQRVAAYSYSIQPRRLAASQASQARSRRRFSDGAHLQAGLLLGGPRRMSETGAQPRHVQTPLVFTQTVQQCGLLMPQPVRQTQLVGQLELAATVSNKEEEEVKQEEVEEVVKTDDRNTSIDSNETIKNEEGDLSGVVESESPLENDEWCEFLDGQLEEMLAELETDGQLDCVDNPNFLQMIIAPLRNRNTNSTSLQKICSILTLPLTSIDRHSDQHRALLAAYHDKQIVNLLLLALKNFIFKEEDLEEYEKEKTKMKLSCLLVNLLYSSEIFIKQISKIDSDLFKALLQSKNSELLCDTFAVINQILLHHHKIDAEFVKCISQIIVNQHLSKDTNPKVLQKSLISLGLFSRNFLSDLKNRTEINQKISLLSTSGKEENQNLLKAISFTLHFLE